LIASAAAQTLLRDIPDSLVPLIALIIFFIARKLLIGSIKMSLHSKMEIMKSFGFLCTAAISFVYLNIFLGTVSPHIEILSLEAFKFVFLCSSPGIIVGIFCLYLRAARRYARDNQNKNSESPQRIDNRSRRKRDRIIAPQDSHQFAEEICREWEDGIRFSESSGQKCSKANLKDLLFGYITHYWGDSQSIVFDDEGHQYEISSAKAHEQRVREKSDYLIETCIPELAGRGRFLSGIRIKTGEHRAKAPVVEVGAIMPVRPSNQEPINVQQISDILRQFETEYAERSCILCLWASNPLSRESNEFIGSVQGSNLALCVIDAPNNSVIWSQTNLVGIGFRRLVQRTQNFILSRMKVDANLTER